MQSELSQGNEAAKPEAAKPRRKTKANTSPLERLSAEELQSLRLDEESRTEFDARAQRFNQSRAELQSFEGEDAGAMDDERYDQLSAAQAKHSTEGMAVVHFLAPRILRLRDGAAKRKWRSFLTKFRKDEKLS